MGFRCMVVCILEKTLFSKNTPGHKLPRELDLEFDLDFNYAYENPKRKGSNS